MTTFTFTIPSDEIIKTIDSYLRDNKSIDEISILLKIDKENVIKRKRQIIMSHINKIPLKEIQKMYHLTEQQCYIYEICQKNLLMVSEQIKINDNCEPEVE
jgi:hypothetical protein